MDSIFSRTALLIGEDSLKKLQSSKVIIFGLGGVGSYVCEALARSGVGYFHLVDNDIVDKTNINRQLIATVDTIGKNKVDVMRDRILSINPDAEIEISKCFYLPENSGNFDFEKYDYIIDAIDTVTAKIDLVVKAKKANTRIISSMGTGNKLDPTRFEVSDIYKTSVCPLCKVMRRELKKREIDSLKVVYSKEEPKNVVIESNFPNTKKRSPGSTSFVPSVAGLIIASEVVKDLIKTN